MRKFQAWLLLAMIALAPLFTAFSAEVVQAQESRPVAVLELFTSQGCSSCPPADELLAQIQALQAEHKLPVYCLSFHVDYWNSLGWTDPFSKPQFSKRQRDYARGFGSRSVYTPQLIVNGRREFVGSKASAAKEALREALDGKSVASIELSAKLKSDSSRVALNYQLTGAPNDSVLNVAVVQRQGKNQVPRGENAGRSLKHVNVVREFVTRQVTSAQGELKLPLPQGVKPSELGVIAYLQSKADGHILGAAAAELSN